MDPFLQKLLALPDEPSMFKSVSAMSPSAVSEATRSATRAPHRRCAATPAWSRITRALLAHCAGSISLEYAVLIGGVALGGALGLIGIGLALLDSFVAIRAGVLAPFP
jgi:hypothetical protein